MAGARPEGVSGAEADQFTCLSEREALDWIRLIRSENVGPIAFADLLAHYGSASAALDALPDLRQRGGVKARPSICSLAAAERELQAAIKCGARLLALTEPDYPPLLRHIAAPPPLLYALGDPRLAAGHVVAIVGSRNASAAGRQFAALLASDLGRADIAVASGLARGIDTAAHEAALGSGTIAVLAGGVNVVYPPENGALHREIAQRGLILSETPPGISPRGQDFPRRNRIISGLAWGVVIVEAALKSGSLITARMALEQDREVFAVPGHPLDPRAAGTNGLIRSGAHLVTGAEDVLAELHPVFRSRPVLREPPIASFNTHLHGSAEEPNARDREILLDALSLTPLNSEMLLRNTPLSPRRLAVALLELELAGRIDRSDGERISLKPNAPVT